MAAYQQYLYTTPYILLFVNKCNKKVIVIFFFYDYVRRDLYCANLIKSTIRLYGRNYIDLTHFIRFRWIVIVVLCE